MLLTFLWPTALSLTTSFFFQAQGYPNNFIISSNEFSKIALKPMKGWLNLTLLVLHELQIVPDSSCQPNEDFPFFVEKLPILNLFCTKDSQSKRKKATTREHDYWIKENLQCLNSKEIESIQEYFCISFVPLFSFDKFAWFLTKHWLMRWFRNQEGTPHLFWYLIQ